MWFAQYRCYNCGSWPWSQRYNQFTGIWYCNVCNRANCRKRANE